MHVYTYNIYIYIYIYTQRDMYIVRRRNMIYTIFGLICSTNFGVLAVMLYTVGLYTHLTSLLSC